MLFLSGCVCVTIILYCRSNNGLRNTEQQKISKYINTRVTEVFPVRKARNLGKENCKVRVRCFIHFDGLIDAGSFFSANVYFVQWFRAKCKISCRMPYRIMRRSLSLLMLQLPQILHHLHFHGNDLTAEL